MQAKLLPGASLGSEQPAQHSSRQASGSLQRGWMQPALPGPLGSPVPRRQHLACCPPPEWRSACSVCRSRRRCSLCSFMQVATAPGLSQAFNPFRHLIRAWFIGQIAEVPGLHCLSHFAWIAAIASQARKGRAFLCERKRQCVTVGAI